MSVCKTCGKQYSKWISLVNTRGVCGDCFETQLSHDRKAEPQIDVAPALVTSVPQSKANADAFVKKGRPQPLLPLDVFLETLGFTLAFFAAQILRDLLGPESRSTVTAQGVVASTLPHLGWILLVVCLLNRSGSFQWRLPRSKKAWLTEFGWGAVLLVTIGLAK